MISGEYELVQSLIGKRHEKGRDGCGRVILNISSGFSWFTVVSSSAVTSEVLLPPLDMSSRSGDRLFVYLMTLHRL
jgi:hypothetical protein